MMHKAIILGTIVYMSLSSHAQESGARKDLLIEATQTIHGIGNYREQHLWVRLMKDGSLEWEESGSPFSGKPNQTHSSQISAKRVAAIEEDLNSTDWTGSRGRMGPYNGYVDSSVEIQVHLVTGTGDHQFVVINPWPYRALKALPAKLKHTLCQLQIVRAQASGQDKIMAMCTEILRSLECSEGSKPCVKP